jgi:hypothetical protein
MALPEFPNSGSIPPVCFYTRQGLADWLNQNPTYKKYFTTSFPYLYVPSDPLKPTGYNIEKVPLQSPVRSLSASESRLLTKHLTLFRNVYTFNQNAYLASLESGATPIYYRFRTGAERQEYRSAMTMVNKLYPFRAMLIARDETSEAKTPLGWIIPFPIYSN